MIIDAYPHKWFDRQLPFSIISDTVERRISSMERRKIERVSIIVKPDYTYIRVNFHYHPFKFIQSDVRPLSEIEIKLSDPDNIKDCKTWVKKYVIPNAYKVEQFPPVRGRKLWSRYTIEPEIET